MNNTSSKMRIALLTGTGMALATGFGASPALADPAADQTSTSSITIQQEFNDFTTPTPGQTLNGNTNGTVAVEITTLDEEDYALQNSTVTVGSSATTGNTTSAAGYANSADLTVNADLNNVAGSGFASETATYTGGATVSSTADIGVALSQQNVETSANIADSTDLGIALDNGATASTVTIAGNRQSATGVLNSGTTLVDASANNSSGSSGIAASQSSVNSDLAVSVSSLAAFETGAGTSGIALNDSTAELTDNRQSATAVANSGSNTQAVSGNELTLAGSLTGNAFAANTLGGAAAGGYATASNQTLDGSTGASVSASISDAAGVGGYVATINGDVLGSTLNNDRNTANALARGNEVANATSIDANSIATGSLATPVSGTVAAIGSQQSVTGAVDIIAAVTGGGSDGPMVSNVINGDVGPSSTITASGNAVLADAAGNRGGNAITASATTIDTSGVDGSQSVAVVGQANSVAAFAVANSQEVSAGSTITASLVDSATNPTAGTSVSTDISGSVANSSVEALGNSLTASVAGNESLGGGNSINLSGTNVATSAAVGSSQTMNGVMNAVIGSEGTDAVPAGTENFVFTGSSSDGTFTGTAAGDAADALALQAAYAGIDASATFTHAGGIITFTINDPLNLYTQYTASYTTPGTAGTPASGGVVVTVGNDITNSSIAVDGNATAGSVIANSSSNSITASATDLASGSSNSLLSQAQNIGGSAIVNADMAVANNQLVGPTSASTTVGAVFGVTAEGIGSTELSDVSASTLSVSGNSESATTKGNEADNSIQLSATNVSNTSALGNVQQLNAVLRAEIADFSGAFATVGRDVTNSSVLVDGNEISGTIYGNDAANSVSVTGSSTIAQADGTPQAVADPNSGGIVRASADHALLNDQSIGFGASLITAVTAGYGITTLGAGAPGGVDDTSDISGSALSVSDNEQSAMTTANNASNGMSITGGAIATNGALLSRQVGIAGTTTAFSNMTVGAPGANEQSTLSLNGNANSASATVNSATNSMTVAAATDLAGSGIDADLSETPFSQYSATADYVVNNVQGVSGGSNVFSTATTSIANNDGGPDSAAFETDGIQQSTVDLVGNSTQASATSNSSVNTLNLSANSTNASAGVLNQQDSGASVQALANASVGTEVTGFDGTADASPIDASALTIAGNTTMARAGGNTATSTLNASATNFNSATGAGSTSLNGDRNDSANANFAVLNEQTNTGPINAATSVSYGAGFNSLGAAPTATNAAVMVNGNSAGSVAYGNAATNRMTFTALNSPSSGLGGATTALASNQVNTGNVTASTVATMGASAAGNGVVAGGAVSSSSLSVNGNGLSASAFGNSSTNTVTVSGNNVTFVPVP